MKNFRRILAALLTAAITCSSFAVCAQETETVEAPAAETQVSESTEKTEAKDEGYNIPERVEIIFKVGDDVLLINGEEVKVEAAPYVVGTGTTLVPVRVITEAFGAKVGWDGEARKVTLDYPDVNIVLTIDNIVAEVNGEAVTLLAAPEIQNGRTMIPLRFISENFGADVGYDEETKGITVVKETVAEGETVEGVIDTAYIGDSFYSWTMSNPKDLTMTDRTFDGRKTRFDDENGNYIIVKVSAREKDFDIEEFFKDEKEFYTSYATLIKAEKKEVNEKLTTMLFNARTSEDYLYFAVYVTDTTVYSVEFVTENKDELKSSFVALAESFKLEFAAEDTHDLSNLENGMRKFESDEMNFTLLLPAEMSGGEQGNKVNVFRFTSNTEKKLQVLLKIFSKSEAIKAPVGYVEYDIGITSNGANLDLVHIGGLQKKTYGNLEAYEYDIKILGSKEYDQYGKYMSFELGEYVYILSIAVDAESVTPPDTVIASIIDNMKFEEIDPEKVGIIMDTSDIPEKTEDKEIKLGNMALTVPYTYEKSLELSGTDIISDNNRGIDIMFMPMTMPAGAALSDVAKIIRTSLINTDIDDEDAKLEASEPKRKQIDGKVFYKFNLVISGEDRYEYNEVYLFESSGMVYVIIIEIPEIYKSAVTLKEIEDIVSSIRKK